METRKLAGFFKEEGLSVHFTALLGTVSAAETFTRTVEFGPVQWNGEDNRSKS